MPSSNKLNEDKFKTLFNMSQDGIAILDLNSNFLDFNPAYLSMTGLKREELLTKNYLDLTNPKDIQQSIKVLDQVIKQRHVDSFEQTCLVKNGKPIKINMALALLPLSKQILVSTKDITEKVRLIDSLEKLSKYDSLTLLPNRYTLTAQFKSLVKNLDKSQNLYLCFFDLDGFKSINDQHGHATGDQLLKQVADRLQKTLHQNEMVARLSGDEFAIILLADSQASLLKRQQATLKLICQPYIVESTPIPLEISSSVGISQLVNKEQEFDTLLRQAEQAMHYAKLQGRARIEIFSHETNLFYKARSQCITEITRAISQNELILHYQPKVNLRSEKIIGFEALIRWQSPEKGLVYPNDFIPLIESSDLIIPLGEWVAREAMNQLALWNSKGYEWGVSINIATKHFQHVAFLPFIKSLFDEHPELSPNLLDIEILESIAFEDMPLVKQIIADGQDFGITFSLDDFGTGFSSLSYLKSLRVNTLKIDRAFIQDMLTHEDEMILVEIIISLGKLFKLDVIAEGVESVEHAIVLMRYGCNLVQGFEIAKPMPSNRVIPWAKSFLPHPSWALWADAQWDIKDFPVLIAESDHLSWVEKVLLEVNDPSSTPDFNHLKDHNNCRFGQWYYSHGMDNYQDLASFKEIEAIHQEVHHVGEIIFELKLTGDSVAVDQYVTRLLELKDQILALLKNLQHSFVQKLKTDLKSS